MKDQALHITNAILFDEDMALKGDREVREVRVEDNIITVTIAVEKANDVKTRYAMEDAA